MHSIEFEDVDVCDGGDELQFVPEDACPCGSGTSYDDCCGLYD